GRDRQVVSVGRRGRAGPAHRGGARRLRRAGRGHGWPRRGRVDVARHRAPPGLVHRRARPPGERSERSTSGAPRGSGLYRRARTVSVTKRNPNTFIVGAGPVATALAGAMRLGGIPVLGLWARTPQAARSAGAIAGVASYSTAPPDLMLEADVVVLAVRDDAIAEVATMLV